MLWKEGRSDADGIGRSLLTSSNRSNKHARASAYFFFGVAAHSRGISSRPWCHRVLVFPFDLQDAMPSVNTL